MDDGQQVKRGGVTLCTDSFNSDQVNSLREILLQNFNIITSIHKKTGRNGSIYERIYINKDSLDKNKDQIIPHMHESMLYKINAEIPTDNPNTALTNQDQGNDEPTNFKQNTKDIFDTNEDNILGNLLEDN
jgi:hypothetical protein